MRRWHRSLNSSGLDRGRGDAAGRRLGRTRIGRIGAIFEYQEGGGTVELTGIKMGKPEIFGKPARQGALAGCCRPVDRDDYRITAHNRPRR